MAKKLFQRIDAHGRTIDDDDEGPLKNGQGIRVNMMMMDALQQTVAADAAARCGHRSGYQYTSGLLSDARADIRDEREQAYLQMCRDNAEAYKHPAPTRTRVADLDFTQFAYDPVTGFFTGSGKLDPEEIDATKKLFHSPPAAASANDAEAARAERDAWLVDAWRNP